jgi:hypothetical protein
LSRIWIDLDNAPHIPFFKPLIGAFAERGCSVDVTLRDFGFTRSLAEDGQIPYTAIGTHPGGNRVAKVLSLGRRTLRLAAWAKAKKFDVALSHGSRGLVAAARLVGVPAVTMFDYEHVSSGLFRWFSHHLLLPEPLRSVFGPPAEFYPGYKEEVYLDGFDPDISTTPVEYPPGHICVVIRPPATTAHYHDHRSETIFEEVIRRIEREDGILGIVAPRTMEQGDLIAKSLQNPLKFHILQHSVPGLDLVWHADLVIGGGGTMNREAALLGVPTYSIFTGPKGLIDASLEAEGRLTFIESPEDVTKIKVKKRPRADTDVIAARLRSRGQKLRRIIVDDVLGVNLHSV